MKDFNYLHSAFEEDGPSSTEKPLPEIILVEDDRILGKTIKKFLEKKLSLKVHYFEAPSELLSNLPEEIEVAKKPFCLITDITFDHGSVDGLLLIDLLREKDFKFVSLVMTGFASIETAIMATKKGVFHYLTKPFEMDVLSDLVLTGLKKVLGYSEELIIKNSVEVMGDQVARPYQRKLKIEAPDDKDMFCGMIGRSKKMKEVFERIKKVAPSDSTVLINGPSGTGKELVSNAIHTLSKRRENVKVSVNCGAIPGELLESELFGHEKGAFTGAISNRKGRFEIADKGTIFLDEIGDMPLLLQVKLLRVLQNREIERVGGSKTLPVDVRIITATHRDLDKSVAEGNFREDLFYRLNVIPVKVPSLAERKEDIPLLISHFLGRFSSADGRNSLEFDQEVLEIFLNYDWPGNVRELENLIERLVILRGGSVIKAGDLPAKFLQCQKRGSSFKDLIDLPDEGLDLKGALSDIENSLIMQALERTSGNKNQASKLLNMNRTTLIEKMKKKGLVEQQPQLN